MHRDEACCGRSPASPRPRFSCRHIATRFSAVSHHSRSVHIHSHYENLKVSRDAPVEVIRAAYRALCRKYHPDRRVNDAEAALVMPLLNAAYDTLSDPVKRRQHDEWIAHVEAGLDEPVTGESQERPRANERPTATPARSSAGRSRGSDALLACVTIALLILIFALLYLQVTVEPSRLEALGLSAAVQRRTWAGSDTSEHSNYVRRPFAPNGMPWPEASGYIEGYAKLQSDGVGSVTLDNSANRADVFAKLIAHFNSHRSGVRAVFIHAGGTFTLENVRAGTYEVHYLDLDNGIVQRSGAFTVPETKSLHGASTVAVALLAATRSPRDPQFTSGADF
jgi:DnaJ-domain-containing protein 1